MTQIAPTGVAAGPPAISPVPKGAGPRPLWSVMVPTFNCAKYLGKTLEGVLRQDPGPGQMQIEVVDDCSDRDDPEAVVRDVGRGRVGFHRKPKNEGAVANFNTCIQRSCGQLLHILHGDDFVADGFYSEILHLRAHCPAAALFACRTHGVSEDGNHVLWTSPPLAELPPGGRSASPFYYNNPLQFCGVVMRRDFFAEHGGFLPELVHLADCEMWLRAIFHDGGIVSDKILANYRVFSGNDTGKLMRTGENVRDLVRLNSIMAGRFPDFSPFKGRLRAGNLARSQAKQFFKAGDLAAGEANRRLWHELMPLNVRLKKRLWKIFRRL